MKLIQEKPYEVLRALKPKLGQQWIDSVEARNKVDTTQSHFHKTMKKLEDSGLVVKRKHPSSHRKHQYKLTDIGKTVLNKLDTVKKVVEE